MDCRLRTTTSASSTTRRIHSSAKMILQFWIYSALVVLLVLPMGCWSTNTNATSSNSVYRESHVHSKPDQPSGCHRIIKPAYFLENTVDQYRLVVTIPEQVSRKKLKIDVDYNEGFIEVFGWWHEGKVRGETDADAARRKICMYGRWILNADLLSEEAIVSSDLVSVYDIFMYIHEQQLVLSVPMAIDHPSPPPPTPRIKNDDENDDDELSQQHASIVIAYGTTLWKKFRGLVRLKDHARNYSKDDFSSSSNLTLPWSLWEADAGLPPSSLAYEKYRQDALEEFLSYTMATIDKNSS